MDYFYPRSPCGERQPALYQLYDTYAISIHALLAESDELDPLANKAPFEISIHALLAESDSDDLGDRLGNYCISIHALLAESDGAVPDV